MKKLLLLFLFIPIAFAFDPLLYCTKDSDCLIPPQCPDTTSSCIASQCDYNVNGCDMSQVRNYLLVIYDSVPDEAEVKQIPDRATSVTFQSRIGLQVAGYDWGIGNADALSSKPECQVPYGNYLSPSKDGCYEMDINWVLSPTLLNNIEQYVNPSLKISYSITGAGVYYGERKGIDYDYEWVAGNTRDFIIKMTYEDVFDLEPIEQDQILLLDEPADICFMIDNKLFDLQQAGYYVEIQKELIDVYSTITQNKPILKGKRADCITITPNTLGNVVLRVTPYFRIIGDTEYYGDEILEVPLYITNNDFELDKNVRTQEPSGKGKPDSLIYIGIAILAGVVLIGIKK